jgi:chemotaxis protein MotB
MSRKKFSKEGSSGGAPGWMTTFSDLMSLLLTFFILLYSMSTVDAQKFRNITYSLQEALSGLGGPSILEGEISNELLPIEDTRTITENNIGELIPKEILDMYEKVSDYLAENELDANVAVRMNTQGVFVNIKEAILFESGSAELKESGIELLTQLEGLINDFNNDIVIEGHTDNVASNTLFYPSNWELSTARAVTVVRYLSEVEMINPSRLSARGYGEYSPIAPNDTAQNRAINRRVNMFIVFDKEGEN